MTDMAATISQNELYLQHQQQAESDQASVESNEKKKKRLSGLFNKFADIAGRASVSTAIRVAAVTTLVGAGASAYVSIGVAALASGTGAALYTYAKDTAQDFIAARRENRSATWWNKERAKKVRNALLCGVAGGAFGAWLAGTDLFKAGIEMAKESLVKVASVVADTVIPSAHAAAAPLATAVVDHAVDSKSRNALEKLWDMSMSSSQGHGKLMAEMLKTNPADMDSVSPQFLKDRAHDVLRLKDVPMPERVALAKELATEAKVRGNRQAVTFLKEIAKLEKLHPLVSAPSAPAVAAVVTEAAPAPVVPSVADVPAPVEAPAPVETPAQPPAAVARDFHEAAECLVPQADAEGAYDVVCDKFKEVMQPGDHIAFAASDNPSLRVWVPLAEDSAPVSTQNLVQAPPVVNQGVKQVVELRAMAAEALAKAAPARVSSATPVLASYPMP